MGAEGVLWASNNSSPTLTRYHGAAGSNTVYSPASQTVATTYFNALAPWGAMGRVSMLPDGTVHTRCNVNQTSLQSGAGWGDYCYSDTDQTGGEQKMVYIPQFCYAVDTLTANQVWWWVGQVGDQFYKSDSSGAYTFSASDIHPVFSVNGVARQGAFVSAYEGYVSGGNLNSVAGYAPTATQTLATFRGQAQHIGTGWQLMTIQMQSALQLLFILEYATLYSGGLGAGIGSGSLQNTGLTAGVGSGVSPFVAANYGNASYGTAARSTDPVTFRGIENLWGNERMWLEGINLKGNYMPWIAPQTTGTTYAVDTFTSPYVDTTLTLSTLSGYTTAIATSVASYIWAFIPTTVGGSTSTYFCNSCSIGTGNRVFAVSGGYGESTNKGIFWTYTYASSTTGATLGARIQYMPS